SNFGSDDPWSTTASSARDSVAPFLVHPLSTDVPKPITSNAAATVLHGPRPMCIDVLLSLRALEGAEELDERAHAVAGPACGEFTVVVIPKRGAGDVEVGPRDALADEPPQEQRGDDRPRGPAAHVLEIRDL